MVSQATVSIDDLTEGQHEALALAAQHFSAKEIGQRLRISHRTVEQRLDAARKKLGAENRAEAARIFQQQSSGLPYQILPDLAHIDCAAGNDAARASPERDLVFSDVAAFEQTPPWLAGNQFRLPEVSARNLGVRSRLLWIVGMAVAGLVLVLVGLAVSQALSNIV